MNRVLVCLVALACGSAAQAQAWDAGPVEPKWSRTRWSPPIPPDSPHPADAFEPASADEDGYTRALWTGSRNARTSIGTSGEAKFRTNCRPTFTKRADPILARGEYPALHGHTFFGPIDPHVIDNVENFDYAMGRAYPGSSCQGGPLNATLYWEPSVYREIDGLILTVMPDVATFYYTHTPSRSPQTTRLRRNLRFIGGANPMDYNDSARRREYAAAGLLYPGSSVTPAGFGGVSCHPDGKPAAAPLAEHALEYPRGGRMELAARYVKGPNGEDPWGGACTEGHIVVTVHAPTCWDGANLGSPNGRDHFRYSTRARNNSPPAGQCPDNYVRVMSFQGKVQFDHRGWEQDLQHWYLSSDRMNPSDTPGDPDSLDPCRRTGPYFCAFSTAHFDWWGAWDEETIVAWQRNCGGLTIGGVASNHADCGSGGVDTSVSLRYGGTPPEPGLSTDPMTSRPKERLGASDEEMRYFPVSADDQVRGVAGERHSHH